MILKYIIIFMILFFPAADSFALEQEKSTKVSEEGKEDKANPGAYVISLFKKYVSPVDGDRCPSYPSCSSYSIRAFKKHGFVMGWLMTVDRLIHEGSEEKKVSPVITVNGMRKIYDPVENNDFWWFKKPEKDKH